MSYVLDALKKADAERERGAVPGLHAQPMPSLMAEPRPLRVLPVWVWWLAGAVIVLMVALLWLLLTRDRSAPSPAPVAPSVAPPAAPLPPPALAQTAPPPAPQRPQPAAITARAEPAPAQPTLQRRPETAERSPATSAAISATRPSPDSPAKAGEAAPRLVTAPAAVQPAASKADGGGEGRIFALNELPDDVRRALPTLTVGGSIYSENAASRFVIINGQVFHENDKLAPDLTLEQIRLKLAVLRYKDVRFRIMF